jgi:hypothetical protein
MQIPKRYFHDRLVLLLLSVNSFLTALTSILILLRLDSSRADNYIVQYRSNLGLSAFKAGGSGTFYSFILFVILNLVFAYALSVRVYPFRRQFAVVILCLALLLVILALIVSNALLVLR